jgi:hypothetical protein
LPAISPDWSVNSTPEGTAFSSCEWAKTDELAVALAVARVEADVGRFWVEWGRTSLK